MKPSTQKSYHERIDRVVGFLSDQVEGNPSLEALADIAAISPFHFHRVYRAVTGETPSGTLRRLRLARACLLLRDTSKPVTEISFEVGYDSSQSFAKAFRVGTGFSPTEIKKTPGALDMAIKALAGPAGKPLGKPGKIEVKVVSVDPIKVIACRHVGPHTGLSEAFGDLYSWAEKAGLVKNLKGIYGIPVDDPRGMPEKECRFDCCFDFGAHVKAKKPNRKETLGGGLYAVLRHLGHYDGLEEKYDVLYGRWLETSGYSLREAPFYNHYLQDPETLPPEQWETDIHLPIKKGELK